MQVDGVTYEIDWRKFRRGTSIFIPCLEPRRAKPQVLEVTQRLNLKVLIVVRIEGGIRGLRIWRV